MSVRERDAAALAAVSALMTVLAGDGRRDRGLLAKRHQGTAHLRECNRGLYLSPGSHAAGGAPCSPRCLAAHEALRLGETFLRLLIDECDAAGEPRLREAV